MLFSRQNVTRTRAVLSVTRLTPQRLAIGRPPVAKQPTAQLSVTEHRFDFRLMGITLSHSRPRLAGFGLGADAELAAHLFLAGL